jgi:hypothetical protein
MLEADKREQLVGAAFRIVRQRNWERYGIDDVEEQHIRGLNDRLLEHIVTRDEELQKAGI